MRFIIMVKATADSEAGVMPPEALIADMARYHEALARAGVLLDGSGLRPSAQGWRVRYAGERRTVVDGPFTEIKELIAGYTLIEVGSREEALEWSRRFPNPAIDGGAAEIEVRRLYELEDFGDSAAVERHRALARELEQGGAA
ncbi:YciI family protein [Ectothiorhodospiraceae bacterium 2226]|nr:YciI family protein [Ectothiorhodospiraceae bacterium 2226]